MFRAYDATRERLVAVKLFKLDLPPERGHQLVAEFERLIAADLTHPAIAAPLATGISGVSAFLAQDYVAADSLDLAVREYGAAPPGNALRVAAQLAGALDYAAAAQITHGALHPRDVLLSSDDTRLIGLGITRALERIGVVAPVRRPYTAPERIAGGEWDRRADVFSLAALVHELMWARRVSGLGAQAASSLTSIAGADLAALQTVFARALAEQPEDRFETALAFAEALRNACPDVAIAPEPAPTAKRRAAPRESEPRLPLDEEPAESDAAPDAVRAFRPAVSGEPDVMQAVRSAESDLVPAFRPAVSAEPDVVPAFRPAVSAEPDVVQAFRPAGSESSQAFSPGDLDIVTPAIAEPEIAFQPVTAPTGSDPSGPIPAGLIGNSEPDIFAALERTRSAVWPLVLALGVGIAIGFAGGFFAGSREQTPTAASATAVPPPAAAREFTESAVPAAAPAPPANAELKTQNSELKTQSSEPKNLKSEPTNLKSETSNLKSSPDGRLLIRTRPTGARIAVDGKDYGRAPATVRDLARGAHHVKITQDGFTSEERRFVITASRPSQSLIVPLVRARPEPARAARAAAAPAAAAGHFTGVLVVDSRPAGAKVFVDGKLVGATPMSLPSVAAGSHAIRLEHDGYQHWSSSVRVVASEQNRVTASLER